MKYWPIYYLVIGGIVLGIVSTKLKKKGIDTSKEESALAIVSPTIAGFFVFIAWPILAPVWYWSAVTSKKEKEEFERKSKKEDEKKKNDPHYGMSMDQKIEKLKELSEKN